VPPKEKRCELNFAGWWNGQGGHGGERYYGDRDIDIY